MTARRKRRGNCGRWLSDEESLTRGYGPVCAERLGIPTGKPARLRPQAARADPAPEVGPGQTVLELQPMQPSLWSL